MANLTHAEPPEGEAHFVFGGVPVRAGFRLAAASTWAGGPVELEFFIETTGPETRYFLVTGDRMRQSPGSFSFSATFAGTLLPHPFPDASYLGGPAAVVEITANRPWRQPIILNEFVCLEAVLGLLAPGAVGQLMATCRRPLPLAATEADVFALANPVQLVETQIALTLHRDDAQLSALANRLVEEVRYGPREQRERPLALLLALRAPVCVSQWRTLADHTDAAVRERVRRALAFNQTK